MGRQRTQSCDMPLLKRAPSRLPPPPPDMHTVPTRAQRTPVDWDGKGGCTPALPDTRTHAPQGTQIPEVDVGCQTEPLHPVAVCLCNHLAVHPTQQQADKPIALNQALDGIPLPGEPPAATLSASCALTTLVSVSAAGSNTSRYATSPWPHATAA